MGKPNQHEQPVHEVHVLYGTLENFIKRKWEGNALTFQWFFKAMRIRIFMYQLISWFEDHDWGEVINIRQVAQSHQNRISRSPICCA